jgi:hypothetical protein
VYQRALIRYERWCKLAPGATRRPGTDQERLMSSADQDPVALKKGLFGGGGVHRPVRT